MPRVLLAVSYVALLVFAVADCILTPQEEVRGIPKPLWIMLIVLVPWAGPLVWLIVGHERGNKRVRKEMTDKLGDVLQRGAKKPRPTAPDEDPEFLRRLDEQARKRKRERERDQETRRDEAGESDAGNPDED
ncbi:PLD nuclease N-terminal domain-containing protein [Dermabacteraceae bacterium P9123]